MPGKLPLYESLLVFENYPVDFSSHVLSESETRTSHFQVLGSQTNYALTFLVTLDKALHIRLVYHRQRIDSGSVPKLLEHFTGLLEMIALNSEQPLEYFLRQIPFDQVPKVRPYWKVGAQAAAMDFIAPRTPTEQTLARIWADALGVEVERVGIQHSFFELGGYSLLAIEIISKVRDTFQIELPLRFLFEAPTIADLAIVVAQKQAEQVDSDTLEQMLAELEQPSMPEQTADDPLPVNGSGRTGQ
jgi:acyl carrier protein